MIILLILITLSVDNVWILLGENCCWSLLALKGLILFPSQEPKNKLKSALRIVTNDKLTKLAFYKTKQVTASSYTKRATIPLFRAEHFEFLSAIQSAQSDYVPAMIRRIELRSVLAQMAVPRRPLYIS